ncbi:MAG: prepilin-type N-terminal cleavage/methylation domain-containing protein [Planctomycetes bacterium]|nr:prepilin-type N-terminal cleavage/methylation domain-containing protein [Planctomycetota bacterium]
MRTQRSLTLIELLVAVTLGVILVGVVTFVWLRSSELFNSTLHRLEAYQRMRAMLDTIERDLANTNRTTDMEFFVDADPDGAGPLLANGHRDDGEPRLNADDGGALHATYDPNDPVQIEGFQEFIVPELNAVPYFYGPVVGSAAPYQILGQEAYIDSVQANRNYWQDEVYVRTFAMVDGVNRPALVHYRLVQPAAGNGRSVLRRRVWYLDDTGTLVRTAAVNTDRTYVLGEGLCDLKVGFFFKQNAAEAVGASQPNGYWFQVGGQNAGDPEYIKDLSAGYADALSAAPITFPNSPIPVDSLSSQHVARDQFKITNPVYNPPATLNAVSFYYKGVAKVEESQGRVEVRTINGIGDQTGLGYNNFDFRGVRPGDQIFLSGATDDDADNTTPLAGEIFPDRSYTVDSILAAQSQYISLTLQEPINLFRLRRRWLKGETKTTVTANGAEIGPTRDVETSFNVNYRIGFLPAAFRVKISIDDRYNEQVLPMERVIRLIQQ